MNVCPRCTKNTNGVHTCTPTEAWRELERQRDELLDALEKVYAADSLRDARNIAYDYLEAIASVEGKMKCSFGQSGTL